MAYPLFAFGTLRDPEVLEVVLERVASELDCVPARLRGYRVARLPDESYPVLIESRDGSVDGMLLRGLSDKDFDRIAFFESNEYRFERCRVEVMGAGEVNALYCSEGVTQSGPRKPWSLEEWQRAEKPEFMRDLKRYMQLYGYFSAEEADAQWIKWKLQ